MVDINAFSEYIPSHTSPIDWAIIEDNMEVLKALLRAKENRRMDAIESPAFTPVTCAAHFQRFECLNYLLESGHDASEYDEKDCSPMFHAVHPDMFTRILQFSEPSMTCPMSQARSPQPNTSSYSPLIQTKIDIVRLLQNHGASLKACRQGDFNCLHLAIADGDPQLLQRLLKSLDVRGYVNQDAKNEWSPLSFAISLGNEPTADMLLAHGANVNQISSMRGFNALHVCAIYARLQSAEIALKLTDCSPKLINSRSRSGYTALHFAAIAGNVPLINALAARKAHLMAASSGITPLGLAIAYWSEVGVEEICKIHKKRKIPYVTAFDAWRKSTPVPVSQAVGPFTMILAPGYYSVTEKVRDLCGRSDKAGCHDPPLSGPAESMLRTILQYPASGCFVEFLKIWYYQITQQYSSGERKIRECTDTLGHRRDLFFRFVVGAIWFIFFGPDEFYDSIRWALMTGDSKAVDIILEESPYRNTTSSITRLIRHSQDRIMIYPKPKKDQELIAPPKDYVKIVNLLMSHQRQLSSQVKLGRIDRALRIIWRPLYRLYLDLNRPNTCATTTLFSISCRVKNRGQRNCGLGLRPRGFSCTLVPLPFCGQSSAR